MSITDICRVCLCDRKRLYTIRNTVFQEIWERLTNSKFTTGDGKPLFVCYICHAQLKKSHQLRKRALKAEKLLTTIINNGSEHSQKTIFLIASLTRDLDYNYSIKKVDQFECKELETNTVRETKNENEEGCAKDNEEEKDINIKEEVEDWSESHQEENLGITNVESDTPSGDNKFLKKILEREVQIILKKIDTDAPAAKRKLNEVPQEAKRIRLEETTKGRKPLINCAFKSLSKNNCKTSATSFPKKLYVSSNNMKIAINKQTIKSTVKCYQGTKTSSQVNILPKHEIQDKDVTIQNDKILPTICFNNAENDSLKQCHLKSANTPSTSLYRSAEGNKSNICYSERPKKDFLCPICQYKFNTNNALCRHLHKHTGEKPYICDLCDYRCARKDHLIQHINYKHTKEKRFSCHTCPYKSVTKKQFNRHLHKHFRTELFICDFCDYRCLRKDHLILHIKFKHTKEKSFSCHTCQYKCVTKNQLNRHLCKHLKAELYICDLCDYRCAQKGQLKIHKKHKHIKKTSYSCHICQYKCRHQSTFDNHLRTHTGEKPYTCDSCDYRCAQKGRLYIHIKFKHTKERNYSCYVCQFKFVTKSDLDIHLRKHTGEKPYVCGHCDYRCTRKEHLTVHIKRKHTKEKDFSCDICEHKFVTKSNLVLHLRTHTGVKPYTCEFCDFKCTSRSALNSHTISKHAK